jgi:hypothetical protein
MCGRCGVHVGAQMEAGRYHAIANLSMPRGHFCQAHPRLGIGSCREKLVRTYTAVLKS